MSNHGRFAFAAVLTAVLCATAATEAVSSPSGRFTYRGTVTAVVDGDTLQVRLLNGKLERVRLIGVDTPERGKCFAAKAAAISRTLAQGKRVTLRGDPTQDTRDRYRRLLAYVWLPGGKDLGYQLVSRGAGKVYVFERPFQRLGAYRNGETRGRNVRPSVWTCGVAKPKPTPEPPAGRNCDPSYPTVCIPPYDQVGDLDCADVPYEDFAVRGNDPHGFDGDGDGVGCES